mgnify:CR=1 FL=1
MQIQGQNVNMTQSQAMTYRYDVEEVADTSIHMAHTLTRVKGSTEVPMAGQNQSYDSAESTSGVNARMQALLNQSIRFQVTPTGTVTEVDNGDAVIDRMLENGPSNLPSDTLRAIYRDILTPDSFRKMTSFGYSMYPEQPVAVGDSWTSARVMNMGVPIQLNGTYTLTEVDASTGTALLDVAYDVSSPDEGSTLSVSGMSMTMNMSGTMSGMMRMDLVTGMLRDQNLDMDMEADASMENASLPGGSMSMTMDMTGTATTTMTPTTSDE